MRRGWTSGVPLRIPERHSGDLLVGVQLGRLDASVSVPLTGGVEGRQHTTGHSRIADVGTQVRRWQRA
jgi:hypothetical protein